MRDLLSLLGVASPSLLIYGGVELDRVGGHARAPAKPGESGVYDGDGGCDLPCARGSRIPRSGGGERRGMHDILRVGLWCAITLISPLSAAILQLGTASLDPPWGFCTWRPL
jgi:hypothetical protein